jgi:hypothetical protein
MPLDWSAQLCNAYPRRSGPSGWHGTRLMLALRRALIDSTWEQIIDGCKRYKAYCQASGKEGTDYVQAPQRFIEDQSYLEQFTHQVPEDPRVIEARAKENARLQRAISAGRNLSTPLDPYPGESAASFETRIMLAASLGRSGTQPAVGVHAEVNARITRLADRMKHPALGGQTRRGG